MLPKTGAPHKRSVVGNEGGRGGSWQYVFIIFSYFVSLKSFILEKTFLDALRDDG